MPLYAYSCVLTRYVSGNLNVTQTIGYMGRDTVLSEDEVRGAAFAKAKESFPDHTVSMVAVMQVSEDDLRTLDSGTPSLDSAMHSVWLHGDWRWLTQQMITEQKEAAADAVMRYSAALYPDEPLEVADLKWWRS